MGEAGWARLGADRADGTPLLVRDGEVRAPWVAHPAWAQRDRTPREGWTTVATPPRVPQALVRVRGRLMTIEADGALGPGRPDAAATPRDVGARDSVLGPTEAVDCLAAGPGDESILVVARSAAGRTLRLLPVGDQGLRRLVVAVGDVTACAASRHSRAPRVVFLGSRDQGVLRLDVVDGRSQPDLRWLTPAGVPATLRGLAVARLRGVGDLVYAVAGDEAIYRFSPDGVADQRIAVEPAGVGRRAR